MQNGRVSKPYFSVHGFRFLSLLLSHFLDLVFCFENPKMSVPLSVPHHRCPSWPPACHAAASERVVGRRRVGPRSGAGGLSRLPGRPAGSRVPPSDSCLSASPFGPDLGRAAAVSCVSAASALGLDARTGSGLQGPLGQSGVRQRMAHPTREPTAQTLFLWRFQEIRKQSSECCDDASPCGPPARALCSSALHPSLRGAAFLTGGHVTARVGRGS